MYVSRAQQGLFHSPNSPVSKDVVREFDRASRGVTHLPYHVKGGKHVSHRDALARSLARGKRARG